MESRLETVLVSLSMKHLGYPRAKQLEQSPTPEAKASSLSGLEK